MHVFNVLYTHKHTTHYTKLHTCPDELIRLLRIYILVQIFYTRLMILHLKNRFHNLFKNECFLTHNILEPCCTCLGRLEGVHINFVLYSIRINHTNNAARVSVRSDVRYTDWCGLCCVIHLSVLDGWVARAVCSSFAAATTTTMTTLSHF